MQKLSNAKNDAISRAMSNGVSMSGPQTGVRSPTAWSLVENGLAFQRHIIGESERWHTGRMAYWLTEHGWRYGHAQLKDAVPQIYMLLHATAAAHVWPDLDLHGHLMHVIKEILWMPPPFPIEDAPINVQVAWDWIVTHYGEVPINWDSPAKVEFLLSRYGFTSGIADTFMATPSQKAAHLYIRRMEVLIADHCLSEAPREGVEPPITHIVRLLEHGS